MSRALGVVIAGLLACAHVPPPRPQPTVLVVYRPGPAWIPGKAVREQPLKEHGKYLLGLYEKGILCFAGPFTDDCGGAAALAVSSEAEGRAIVAADPAVVAGVMIPEVHPWLLVDWQGFVKKR